MTAEIAPTRKQNHGWLDTSLFRRGDGDGLQHNRVCEYMAEQRGGERAFGLESLAGAERSR
jgi:hypothetical protein